MKIKDHKQLENAEIKYNLIKVSDSDIKIINVDNFWDGPLSGECIWRGEKYYFECFDQLESDGDTDRWPRKYLLLNLTDRQKKENAKLQKLFDKSADSEKLRKEYIELYKAAPEHIIEKDQMVAWFDSYNLSNE
jgi:hypothetical protein